MSLVDTIGNAMSRAGDRLGSVVAMILGILSSSEPEKMGLLPDATVLETMIAEAAYHRAGQRGFADGYELCDWLDAEKEILSRFNAN